jgi:hypothetical protein
MNIKYLSTCSKQYNQTQLSQIGSLGMENKCIL